MKKIIFLAFLCVSFGYLLNDIITDNTLNTFEIEAKSSCESDSMGLTINCNYKYDVSKVTAITKLKEGDIYVFKNPNPEKNKSNVMHRLVKDCSKGCTGYIFKGDNNYIADEIINRTDIIYKLDGIKYDN